MTKLDEATLDAVIEEFLRKSNHWNTRADLEDNKPVDVDFQQYVASLAFGMAADIVEAMKQ